MIAVIDSGTNPYHPIFAEPSERYVASRLSGFVEVPLSKEGTTYERFEQDEGSWIGLQPNVLYHFAGTRLLAIGVDETLDDHVTVSSGHGQMTTYLAARESPEAIIVIVQADGGLCPEPPPCIADPSIADAMEWVADQPWIDIVSASIGIPGNLPNHLAQHEDVRRYLQASEKAARSGKLIVTGAGNQPPPPLANYFCGPPWIIAVGGAEADARGESLLAAKTVDVMANFSDEVPHDFKGTQGWAAGTSLATPIVAGVLAKAMSLVWAVDPSAAPSTQQIRDALNASAILLAPTEWDPTPRERNSTFYSLTATNIPVLGPGQGGWGYVDGSIAEEIARRVLESDTTVPPEKQAHALAQSQWQAARETYWSAAPR